MGTQDTTSFRKNLKIEMDGDPWVIVSCQHVKPGKGVAFVKTRIRNLITGRVLDKNFRSGDKVGIPDLAQRQMQYLYNDGTAWCFMDNDNYEQIELQRDAIEESLPFLIDNLTVDILFFNGKAITVDLPTFIEVEVTECGPAFKGDTAQGSSKPATISTGHVLNVPVYIVEGERIKVDTRDGSFSERVKS